MFFLTFSATCFDEATDALNGFTTCEGVCTKEEEGAAEAEEDAAEEETRGGGRDSAEIGAERISATEMGGGGSVGLMELR